MRPFIVTLLLLLCCIVFINIGNAADHLKVKLTGVPPKLEAKVKDNLGLMLYPKYALSSAIKMQATFQQGPQQIKRALQNYGYFKVHVHGHIHYDQNQKTWTVTYTVDLGPPLKITQTQISLSGAGKDNKRFQALFKKSPIHVGRILTTSHYNDLKEKLDSIARDLGYFDAKLIQHQIKINLSAYTAVVILKFDTGARYHFGPVTFKQKHPILSNTFLKRFITFNPKQPYHQNRINQLRRDLNNSNYFKIANVVPKPNAKTKAVPINVNLIPQKPFQLSLGAGYGTSTGPRAMLGGKWRYVTSFGQYLSASIQISTIYQIYNLSYVIPGEKPLSDYTTLNLARNSTTTISYKMTQLVMGVNLTRKFSHWNFQYGLDQHYIHFNVGGESTQQVKYLTPHTYIRYTRRRHHPGYYWHSGYQLSAYAVGTIKNPLSTISFFQGTLQGRRSINLSQNNRILLRALGGFDAVSHFGSLSPNYRFYLGGIDTIRGVKYASIGPENAAGDVIGGHYLFTGSITLEHHFFGQWSGSIFYDNASAFNNRKQLFFYKSVGIGISWRSPLGPISLYVARPLNVHGQEFGFDINIGNFI